MILYATESAQVPRFQSHYNYVKGLETSNVRPLKRVTNSTGKPRHEFSQFRALEKEITRKIKEEDDSSRSYEIFNNRITFWK